MSSKIEFPKIMVLMVSADDKIRHLYIHCFNVILVKVNKFVMLKTVVTGNYPGRIN